MPSTDAESNTVPVSESAALPVFDPLEEFGDRRVPCPECGYDMRGQRVPQCPECSRICRMAELRANPERVHTKGEHRQLRYWAILPLLVATASVIAMCAGATLVAASPVLLFFTILAVYAFRDASRRRREFTQLALDFTRKPSGSDRDLLCSFLDPLVSKRKPKRISWIVRGEVRGSQIFLARVQIRDRYVGVTAARCPAEWPPAFIGERVRDLKWPRPAEPPSARLAGEALAMAEERVPGEFWIIRDGWLVSVSNCVFVANQVELMAHRAVEMLRLIQSDPDCTALICQAR